MKCHYTIDIEEEEEVKTFLFPIEIEEMCLVEEKKMLIEVHYGDGSILLVNGNCRVNFFFFSLRTH